MAPQSHATSAIVLAAGAGSRLGEGSPKALVELAGRPLVALAVAAAAACPQISELVVAVPNGLQGRVSSALSDTAKPLRIVPGGQTRQASVRAALASVSDAAAFVVVHDAARALATTALFSRVIGAIADAASGAAGAVPVVPVVDTLKRVVGSEIVETVDRDDLRAAQTPQAFVAEVLRSAHDRAARAGVEVTDDAAVLEWAGERVVTVNGDPRNFKITTPQDLHRAATLLSESGSGSRADG
jgi:2-C-methyl-D-erythritol 4-phosphate cytidylyltransferase